MSKTITVGLIGYGTVGSGVAQWITKNSKLFKDNYATTFKLAYVCDRTFRGRNTSGMGKTKFTTKYEDILNDPNVDVVIELIGGLRPAKDIVSQSLKNGKHVITANKSLIADSGRELFTLAHKNGCHLFYESSVGAGIPIIKTFSEGLAGNRFHGVYGIINGTCNFILDEMTKKGLSFEEALKDAKKKGYAESDPTLDINGMDSTHKLAILISLAFGKFVKVKDIYTEGITHISHDDITYANDLGLTIKLLAIAKKEKNKIEARVHPTLISKDHPLASIHSVYNAAYIDADPMGKILLSGEGAGQMAAASGIISDLVNLATMGTEGRLLSNFDQETPKLTIQSIDGITTKFYIRAQAIDKPGVLGKITSILGKHNIGINSVTQKAHNTKSYVPIVMLTDYTTEKELRAALKEIYALPTVKGKPVAIRMEKLS